MNLQPSRHTSRRPARQLGALVVLSTLVGLAPSSASASDYYVELIAGQSLLGVDKLDVTGFGAVDGAIDADFGRSFAAGFSFGREVRDRWLFEIDYLYRTNDTEFAVLPDGQRFEEGNFASVVIGANALYLFKDLAKSDSYSIRPYVGLGAAWVQEVDIDFEANDVETEFQTDDFGFQWMLGLRYERSERWAFDFEARKLEVTDVVMEGADGGRVSSDYGPLVLALSYSWRF